MIPFAKYKDLVNLAPIVTVDLIINHRTKILLVKRDLPPLLNQWWTPGGRLVKGEKIESACKRKALEETGLTCHFVRPIAVFDAVFSTSPFGFPQHSISFVCEMSASSGKVILDSNHGDYKWIPKARVEEVYESISRSADIQRFQIFRFDPGQYLNSRQKH